MAKKGGKKPGVKTVANGSKGPKKKTKKTK